MNKEIKTVVIDDLSESPYLENSKEGEKVEKIIDPIEQRLHDFLSCDQDNRIRVDSMRTLFYIENSDPEELEEEIKIELKPATDYD